MDAFAATVSAICYSVIAERCAPRADTKRFLNNAVVGFVLDQHGRMPDYLRRPLRWLTLVFDWWSLPRHGARFHRLSHPQRWRQIEAWRNARLGVLRDFVKFYESLAIFGWASLVEDDGRR